MEKPFSIKLDTTKDNYTTLTKIKQYDTVILYVDIVQNGQPINISNMKCRLNLINGTGKTTFQTENENITILDAAKGKLKIEILNGAFAEYGDAFADITFKSATKNITTVTIKFIVGKAIYNKGALLNTYDKDAIAKVLEFTDSIDEAKKISQELQAKINDGTTLNTTLGSNNMDAKNYIDYLKQLGEKSDNREFTIKTLDWGIKDNTTLEYTYLLTHDLNNKKLIIQAYDLIENKNVTIGYSFIDNTHIKFTSDSNNDVLILISGGFYGGYTSAKIQEIINNNSILDIDGGIW